MNFLTLEDLKAQSFERYITESSADFTSSKDIIEIQAISEVKSKLNGRYDCVAIFDQTGLDRHPLIVKVVTILVMHGLLTRNSARKYPEEGTADYKWAKSWLKDVRDNKENPDGLPLKLNESGNSEKKAMWGNNSNNNYYL